MDNRIESLNDIPSYLLYNKKNGISEKNDRIYVPIIIKNADGEDPAFNGMYAMSQKNDLIDPSKFLFKVSGETYEEVATKLTEAFDKLPVRNRIEKGKIWLNMKGAPKQTGFDMCEHISPIESN